MPKRFACRWNQLAVIHSSPSPKIPRVDENGHPRDQPLRSPLRQTAGWPLAFAFCIICFGIYFGISYRYHHIEQLRAHPETQENDNIFDSNIQDRYNNDKKKNVVSRTYVRRYLTPVAKYNPIKSQLLYIGYFGTNRDCCVYTLPSTPLYNMA